MPGDVATGNVEGADQRRAHRAGTLALGAVHPDIGDEGVTVAEHLRQPHLLPVLGNEHIILWNLAARRQSAPLRGDAFDMTAQLDLFGEQRGACGAILRAVVRVRLAGCSGELGRGRERFIMRHLALLCRRGRVRRTAPAGRRAP